jgi:prevent-host-death family protein
VVVTTIPQKELRNNVGEVLRRAEAGEEFTVTVAGRPAARLGPPSRRQWLSSHELEGVWASAPPETLEEDLAAFPGAIADPFE